MEKMVEYIVKLLVDYPDDVVVSSSVENNETQILVLVNDADMGKVIGKQGRVANSIRALARALANKNNTRVTIKIGKD